MSEVNNREGRRDKRGRWLVGSDLYHPWMAKAAFKLAQNGTPKYRIAEFLEISRQTLDNYQDRYPEFAAALKMGGEPALNRVETALYERSIGYDYEEEQAVKVKVGPHEEKVEIVRVKRHVPPDSFTGLKLMSIKRGGEWREKAPLSIGSMNVNLTAEQARAELVEYFTAKPLLLAPPEQQEAAE